MSRSESSLRGLALGDAFGQTWFAPEGDLRRRRVAPAPWPWTDDTAMALALFRVLREHGAVNQDALAAEFAATYTAEPHRGYGATMHDVLAAIHSGQSWRDVARRQFDGQGSWGNGAAMRVAPLGAWFADDLDELVVQAGKSAGVTHAHSEAITGAVAVAVATALGVRGVAGVDLLGEVVSRLPESEVRAGLVRAGRIRFDTDSRNAGGTLGTGRRISAVDTVPFALWCAARHLDNLVEALWATAAAGGDVDTTCAIVGGVVAARTGLDYVPREWLESCEPLPPFS
ncbi:ADP-ribosylglycohydrolase family protein [Allokutzneria sp. A3M-2-11 16]|uniref:ADP-ribosylglycohydrolase family protein n=1 Tax=Allokutzneria sp. A3M-2-11 16 TaxID=2962043 RepID=UPI0020B78576|nr:ADP-ribosylglycohydrolase family protein [Allokutzneria sp. A3M-2-11 16]MCP3805167.1 ADP-ribosylglycohydrolase family protein [Allokutzneria sp. A3M-2-11 16]